jgi:hypothetical protein
MDGNISKALWLGVSILLFVAVVAIGITVFNGMKGVGDTAGDRIGSIAASLADEEFRAYDGKQVKGDDVLSAIGSFSGQSGDFIVLVRTLGAGTAAALDPGAGSTPSLSGFDQYVSSTGGTISVKDKCYVLSAGSGDLLALLSKNLQDAARRDAENSNLSGYINPSGRFMSQLVYDSNQKIRGAIFAQVQ